ncbi:MAG: hypothetical protein A2057_12170 [Ignavibacteria bacterium GWA2_35_9]|nr:MAG: hypothetical protein A2057_12170 [Ignavibacteria bacterium GWA2_35_9]OGU46801.1 MAG: hypothetical protein A2000_04855 [Ignavibacteria bacterium GWB2_36_8]OGU52963.1 MAG: hypothetical protein A2080_03190 [Ignavibacteria bacterium GWC2_36_12]
MNLKTIKILPAILLFVLAFNFINSEIIDQFEGRSECQQTHDYCKLVQTASIKTSSSDKVVNEDFVLVDYLCPHCLKFESTKELYEKHQNNSFHHLELPPAFLINQSFLI